MDYKACIEYLYTKLPMFSRTGPAALKMDLSNTLTICKELGNPERKLKTIHIAGTNGKGSVSHMIASILQEQGYKTGLYTSPHLYDFRERIRVNGNMIKPEQVIDFTERMIPIIEKISPSFFELTVGMAFDHFEKEHVDVAVIETGLGGRLDSTNVINPLISIITNIGYDHMSILGDTLEQIAAEKAGIIKNQIPVVIGKKDEATEKVFRNTAASKNAPVFFAEEWATTQVNELSSGRIMVTALMHTTEKQFCLSTPLAGIYQQENIRTVLVSMEKLSSLGIHTDQSARERGIANVIQNTGFHGRWELLSDSPSIILDVAHNPAGMNKIKEQLAQTTYDKLYIIIGLSSDKDADGMLQCLPMDASYGFTKADLPRAMEAAQLSACAAKRGLKGSTYPDVNQALKAFRAVATKDDLILVCGSIFLVGEVDRTQFN